ncbi:ATP-binding cassette domain-containing protein [Lentibacter algarum]|uniref:ABC transporter ATP-binding protein n=1 Tax=Lentibacter algarum TaxID=576131 RepID=UPI001C067039|nr:ATP-binding cassette domain-containing protein [Lentibacter algarum]MBU2981013.1 ATP-binding cassette domain-containing protein [Lentibacter algarum]
MTEKPHSNGPSATLEVQDLHKSFGELEVLKGVSMTAREGDVVSIIGSSGSGKSTFLRCINLLEMPTSGSIRLSGEELKFKGSGAKRMAADKKQVTRLRSQLGMVFQSFNLWQHMSVLQNVMEGQVQVLGVPKAEARERAESILQRVGLYEKRDQYPAFLSGGQQQRAAIARAVAMEPKVMLFDEPTSALDPELVGEVLKVIRGLAEEGRTMILVTHEMKFARDVSSEVVYLHEGRVEERGAPGDVFNNPSSERFAAFIQTDH